jgi:hypothetical protein
MTRAELEAIVAWWRPRLGLERWSLRVCWPGDPTDPDPITFDDHQNAGTWRARDYDEARVYFNPDEISGWNHRRANQLAVHELLHLVTREVEWVLDLIDGQLHRDVDDMVGRSHRHAVEGAIDRLAYRLVELVDELGTLPPALVYDGELR